MTMEINPTTRQAINTDVRKALAPFSRHEPLTGAQWADRHFYLSSESSLMEGRWVTHCWQVAMLNAMTNKDVRAVYGAKSKRTGWTKMLLAALAYFVDDAYPWKACIWQPTDADAKDFVQTELEPMIRDVEPVRNKFPYYGKKSSKNTIQLKGFTGAPLRIRGGKSAGNYRRMTLDVAMIDELSSFDHDIDGEGDPLKLATGRTEGAPFAKTIAGSTMKIKGSCQMEKAFEKAEAQMRYHWHCPHCDHEQHLKFGGKDADFGFKWLKDESGKLDKRSVQYECEECHALVKHQQFNDALTYEQCRWLDDVSGVWTRDGETFYDQHDRVTDTPRKIGFHIWAGYSPLLQWWEIVEEWLASCKDPLEIKTFLNTVLGETYDIASGDRADKTALEERAKAETFGNNPVPERVCYVTAGVDVQPDRFEIQFIGWGVGQESWVLDYVVLPCDTESDDAWTSVLDPSLDRHYTHPSGMSLPVSFAAIDTGGSATQKAYRYCKDAVHKGRLAIKGKEGQDRPIIPLRPSKNWSLKGLKGWLVGVDTAKTVLYKRMETDKPGQGYMHFDASRLPEDYFDQLTSETLLTDFNKNGRRTLRWYLPAGKRNEALDTFVYALAALEHSGVDLGLQYKRVTEPQQAIDWAAEARKMNG